MTARGQCPRGYVFVNVFTRPPFRKSCIRAWNLYIKFLPMYCIVCVVKDIENVIAGVWAAAVKVGHC